MAKKRTTLSDDLSAKVMFASDRVCCVCKDSSRKTEIHHIDCDPSNNDFDNLAVMCKDDHSDAHTKHAFARNLNPDLVRKYNENWRAVVRARVTPGGDSAIEIEYQQQVLLEIGLAPHLWKNQYMALFPGNFQNCGSNKHGGDIWDTLLEFGVNKYSLPEWEKYFSLFDRTIPVVVNILQRLLAAHGQHVPTKVKLTILRTISQLEMERSVYIQLLQIIAISPGGNDSLFAERFRAVIRALLVLARTSDHERNEREKIV